EPEQIEPAPRIGNRINIDFIQGMGKHNEMFMMILDIDRVFTAEVLAPLQEIVEELTGAAHG
ncbi:MAG: hypothetical protein L6365_06585, partial [Desulfobulbaceae bacterium]|nr:hypothetical protein [Desulfobulbaceae bacterium]